jgi:hypothetical protein
MNLCHALEKFFDSTIAHSQDSFGHALGLLAVMRHQQQGHAGLAALTDKVFKVACSSSDAAARREAELPACGKEREQWRAVGALRWKGG